MQRGFILAAALFAMATCGYSGQIVLKWGDSQGPTHIAVQMIHRIAKSVAENTNGRIEIQAYPGSQMGSEVEMVEGLSMGTLEIMGTGPSVVGQFVPAINILEAPYVFRDVDHLMKVMSGSIVDEMNELTLKQDIRIIGTSYFGLRHVITTSKEIRRVKDMVGLKLRVPENALYMAMAEAWETKPTPMNMSEVYLGLKQNVVDGMEAPLPNIEASKLFEVEKYLILTGHMINPRLIMINEPTWRRLPPEDQKILAECVAEGIAWNNDRMLNREAELQKVFTDYGMIAITVDTEEFKKPVLDKIVGRFEEQWGKGMWERIQAVR
ncbi:MAG: DctP family TRAP transporter solute-binding subunit [Planctomycetota bacterium]|jgi:tripartite ATP-independent transporter DctP family solute receptor|nr:DctP family TRAP transporter solute-binding subunit [Planctomycetota bacterium]